MDADADPFHVTRSGDIALFAACRQGSIEAATLMLEAVVQRCSTKFGKEKFHRIVNEEAERKAAFGRASPKVRGLSLSSAVWLWPLGLHCVRALRQARTPKSAKAKEKGKGKGKEPSAVPPPPPKLSSASDAAEAESPSTAAAMLSDAAALRPSDAVELPTIPADDAATDLRVRPLLFCAHAVAQADAAPLLSSHSAYWIFATQRASPPLTSQSWAT